MTFGYNWCRWSESRIMYWKDGICRGFVTSLIWEMGLMCHVLYQRWDCVKFKIRDGIVLSLKSEMGLC
jgi:hypothetical protein